MTLLCLGLNHRTAPVQLREQLTFDPEQLAPALESLAQHVDHGLILSTCNRTEIYAQSEESGLPLRIRNFLADHAELSPSQLQPHLYQFQGADCVHHLFRVSAGLDSMVVGEQQVLNQVRTAFSAASQGSNIRGPFSRLFHQAMRVGRQVHHNTRIGSSYRSVSRVSVQLARRLLGDLSQQRVLLIGAGGAGQLVAQALSDLGVRELSVANRTLWRAEELAQKLNGRAVPLESLPEQLAQVDLVISSTGSPGYVITQSDVRQALRHRQTGPMLFIDIAVPRDIDPEVARLEGVQLYDIDSLQMVSEASSESLEREIAWAEELVVTETAAFMEWWEALNVVPTIAAIRAQAEALRRQEVAKTLSKLTKTLNSNGQAPAVPPEALTAVLAEHLEALTAALVKKLLHNPTVYLREVNDPARQQMARDLFNLDGPGRGRGQK